MKTTFKKLIVTTEIQEHRYREGAYRVLLTMEIGGIKRAVAVSVSANGQIGSCYGVRPETVENSIVYKFPAEGPEVESPLPVHYPAHTCQDQPNLPCPACVKAGVRPSPAPERTS